MNIEQTIWTEQGGWSSKYPGSLSKTADLVLAFGATAILNKNDLLQNIIKDFPNAHILGCSTSGEICGPSVYDDSLVITVIQFEHTKIKGTKTSIYSREESFEAGANLAESLDKDGLVHVLLLSDGLCVNGSELVKGICNHLPENIKVTGGLSGDGNRFSKTLVALNDSAKENTIAALGFYGDRLKVGYGSLGGWDPFGPERLITCSEGNILYELDGKSALELYKLYLGKHAEGLPATGLLFPLSLRLEGRKNGLVRTILAVNEEDQSMTFAGDVPEGAYARFMKANFDRLVDGAIDAAKLSCSTIGSSSPDLALLISCVGRKMILKQRIEEEVEAVQEVLGPETRMTGFYSYGEISPVTGNGKCQLHNQTMTITVFTER